MTALSAMVADVAEGPGSDADVVVAPPVRRLAPADLARLDRCELGPHRSADASLLDFSNASSMLRSGHQATAHLLTAAAAPAQCVVLACLCLGSHGQL